MIKIILLELKRYAKLFIFVIKQLILILIFYVKTNMDSDIKNIKIFIYTYKHYYIKKYINLIVYIIMFSLLIIYAINYYMLDIIDYLI